MNQQDHSRASASAAGGQGSAPTPPEAVENVSSLSEALDRKYDSVSHMLATRIKSAERLRFDVLRLHNTQRSSEVFHPVNEWSPTDWACAMAGEAGETCNLVKKLRRGEPVAPHEIGKELADVVIYADLLAARLGLDLGRCVVEKFNEVSRRTGSKILIHPNP
ncbi:MAG: hypothetical protein AAF612_09760 [Planctomycetota bacterium]